MRTIWPGSAQMPAVQAAAAITLNPASSASAPKPSMPAATTAAGTPSASRAPALRACARVSGAGEMRTAFMLEGSVVGCQQDAVVDTLKTGRYGERTITGGSHHEALRVRRRRLSCRRCRPGAGGLSLARDLDHRSESAGRH